MPRTGRSTINAKFSFFLSVGLRLKSAVTSSSHFVAWVRRRQVLLRHTVKRPTLGGKKKMKERWNDFKIAGLAVPISTVTTGTWKFGGMRSYLEFRKCIMRCPGIEVNERMSRALLSGGKVLLGKSLIEIIFRFL